MTNGCDNPLVSIIIPVYNVEDYLAECLESLLLQTYRNVELICVDDGSTDLSPVILQSYAAEDARIRVITQPNSGAAAARNRGLDEAQGEYVLFVDSDDYIALNSCERLVETALRDSADIVVFGGKTFPTVAWKDEAFAQRNITYSGDGVLDALILEPGGRPFMCNKLYSRALLQSCGARFNEGLVLGEDHAFQLFVFPHVDRVSFINDKLYFYRGRDESLVSMLNVDFDATSVRHFDLVEHVIDQWADLGLLAKRPNFLLSWAAGHLYDSMRYTSFDIRCDISEKLGRLVSEKFDARTFDMLDAENRAKLDFMLDSCRVANQPPLASFAFPGNLNEAIDPDTLRAALNQTEQRIECLVDSACASDDIAAIAERDKRCRIVDLSTPKALLEASSGQYIIPASGNRRFDDNAVSEAIDFLDFQGLHVELDGDVPCNWRATTPRGSHAILADALVFGDHAESIRCEDPFIGYAPDCSKPFESTCTLSFDDIETRGYCVTSLAMGNKLYRADFLKAHSENAQDRMLGTWFASCIAHADSIVFYAHPLVTSIELKPATASGKTAALLREQLDQLETHGESLPGDSQPGYFLALAQLCLTFDESLRVSSGYAEAYDSLSSCVRNCNQRLGEAQPLADTDDATLIEGLANGNWQEHFDCKMRLLTNRLQRINIEQFTTLLDARNENVRLSSRLELFEKSVSYRVGQAVTSPVRKLYYFAKSKRG